MRTMIDWTYKRIVLLLAVVSMALSVVSAEHLPFIFDKQNGANLFTSLITEKSNNVKWNDNAQIELGRCEYKYIGIKFTEHIIVHFDGVPDKLSFDVTPNAWRKFAAEAEEWYVKESTDGKNWSDKIISSSEDRAGFLVPLKSSTRYLYIYYKGTLSSNINDLKVTEKTGITLTPNSLYFPLNSQGQTSETTKSLSISYANVQSPIAISIEGTNADVFITSISTISDGIGVDGYGDVSIDIQYIGMAPGVYSANIVVSSGDYKSSIPVVASIADITKDNAASTGLKSGTQGGYRDGWVYKNAWNLDFSHCFYEDGTPIFDYLYIFGMTTNTDNATDSYTGKDGIRYTNVPKINRVGEICNASTPSYRFKMNDAKTGYTFDFVFDAAKEKLETYDGTMSGKKIYFTGYCPYAYTGITPNDNGFVFIKGSGGEKVDIYLENCEIYTRYKTATGKGGNNDYVPNHLTLGLNENILSGNNSPFLIYSSSRTENAPFVANFHISGENQLKSQFGYILSTVTGVALGITVTTDIKDKAQANGCIAIYTDEKMPYCTLNIDDTWPQSESSSYATNGLLKMIPYAVNIGSVDLGNSHGVLNINGGRIVLRNGNQDGKYTAAMAASYRYFLKESSVFKVYLYGFGGDKVDGTVHINGGTIYTENYKNGKYVYTDTDLRLPKNTIITGGAFVNCDPYMVTAADGYGSSPLNVEGQTLCRYPLEVKTYNSNGSVESVNLDGENTDIQNYYATYGKQSLNASSEIPDTPKENVEYTWVMLPTDYTSCQPIVAQPRRNWVTCIPEITVGTDGRDVAVGGDVSVVLTEKDAAGVSQDVYNKNLLYVDIDDNMTQYTDYKSGSMTIAMPNKRGYITNTASYDIKEELNYMTNAVADEWRTFVAPFDIQHVYVLELANEKELQSVNQSNNPNSITKQAALDSIVCTNIALCNEIYDYILPNENGRAASISMQQLVKQFVNGKAGKDRQKGKDGQSVWDKWKGDSKTYDLRGIYELVPYNGNNASQANFYVYQIGEVSNDDWTALSDQWNYVDGELEPKWSVAFKGTDGTLMKQGRTYALKFPYCPSCSQEWRDTHYDYWTGKFILFVGTGPQTIYGSEQHTSIKPTEELENSAQLSGNYTFAEMSVNKRGGAYIHNTETDLYEAVSATGNTSVSPTQSVLFLEIGYTTSPIKSISRNGKIVYDNNVSTGDSHIPTITGNATLMVQLADGGMEVIPLQSQHVEILSTDGQLVYSGVLAEQTYFAVPAGLYLVRGEHEVQKVMVK